jgi:hypothetical protein
MTALDSKPRFISGRSPYERRLDLVVDVLGTNTELDPSVTRGLAIQILRAVDGIAEILR